MQILLTLILLLSSLYAQTIVVQGTGYGATEGEALQKAKQDALAKGIGQTLISQTEVENFMVKKDLVLTKTAGNIRKYKTLDKSTGPDGVVSLTIEAEVSEKGLREDLAALFILRESIGNPRIAVLILEENQGQTSSAAETELIQGFKDKGFEVVDPNQTLKYKESPEATKALGGDPEAAALLGSYVNAEVIIVGKSYATEADMSHHSAFKNSSMKSASATIQLKAINVSTRRILAASNEQGAMIHPNPETAGINAIKKAVQGLFQKKDHFFDKMTKAWQALANDGSIYSVEINAVHSFKTIKSIKSALQGKVNSMNQRSFNKPKLFLDVKFLGSVEDLCEKLDGINIADKKITVTGYMGNAIKLSIQ
jgi:hypothetical protein